MNNIRIEVFTELSARVRQTLIDLENQIFKLPMTLIELDQELKSKHGLIALIAYSQSTPCGFKIGYEQSPKRFYSWIGGTLPDFRNQGIAKQLMLKQHELAKNKGYAFIATQTKNEFKDMLILNINSGFEINGVRQSLNSDKPAILLEKRI